MIGNQGQQEFRNLNQGQNYENRKFQPDYYQSQEKAQGDLKSEVHFLGQIVGGLDFSTKDGIFCEMLPDAGENWDLLEPQQKTYISQTCYADVNKNVFLKNELQQFQIFTHQGRLNVCMESPI
ncbi:hypothetical protein PPERSA_03379 [Pseudocohnilembus persalinus]|uniref:Uncharacterized protein n=1 Tax=Pseudocohnilembus persalinus TaxID=266149 RepID=A0A0V0R1L7_PSEPJ|nr:hypothetical protein PPERSA_03379 [Pseudocohnilembus persalinus]|eukprot:KRX08385.1 hypothetical protein PPERSA_03379 [Pseudocohnilembus persalinus]